MDQSTILPLAYAGAVVAASALDAILPQPSPSSRWVPLRKLLSFLAWNFGHAANAGQPSIALWAVHRLAAAAPEVLRQITEQVLTTAVSSSLKSQEIPAPSIVDPMSASDRQDPSQE